MFTTNKMTLLFVRFLFCMYSNYSQINHNPTQGIMPLKSSLKPTTTQQHFHRNSVSVATPINKRPARYPSPPSSPSPPPPSRLSTSSMTPSMSHGKNINSNHQTDPNEMRLSELQFPPAPTELGRFRETITKNTLTETVVTRVTCNQKGQLPVITEVI